ncbi:hypothetical protein EON65_45950 [archaeon]|nr:MAG: hypothetical protein EON65_45950 [archaeon]
MSDSTPLSRADLVFRMLSLHRAFIVRGGRLRGQLTRQDMKDFLGGEGRGERRPLDRCREVCRAVGVVVCGVLGCMEESRERGESIGIAYNQPIG